MTDILATVLAREKEAEGFIAAAREKAVKIQDQAKQEIQQIQKLFEQEQRDADIRQQSDTAAIAVRIRASQEEGTELRCQSIERTAEKKWALVKEKLLIDIV